MYLVMSGTVLYDLEIRRSLSGATGVFYLMPTKRSAIIEIDNDERGVIGDFTTISDIRITKVKPE